VTGESAAFIKIGYDTFAKLLSYFGDHRKATALKRQIDAAWRELVKGDATDYAVIESALAAAASAKDTSSDHLRLAETYFRTKPLKKKPPKRKAAPKKPPKKKAAKRK
jgi:hypothetical protein